MQREQLLRTVSLAAVSVQFAAQHLTEYAQQDALPRMMALGTLTSECFLNSSGTMPLHTGLLLCHKINVQTAGWRDIVPLIMPSRAEEPIHKDRLVRSAASGSFVEPLRDELHSQEVGMTGSLLWLALLGRITILYVKKLWTLDRVLGLATTQPFMGFAATT
jgi:hypothetical protein